MDKYGWRTGDKTTDHPFARLIENENFKAYVFVTPDETGSPAIVTFDKSGNVISSIDLLGNWTSNDPSIHTEEVATINKDLSIHLLDSIWEYDVTPEGGSIDSTERITVKDELYKILESGKIQRIK